LSPLEIFFSTMLLHVSAASRFRHEARSYPWYSILLIPQSPQLHDISSMCPTGITPFPQLINFLNSCAGTVQFRLQRLSEGLGSILPSLRLRSIETIVTRFFDRPAIACHPLFTMDEPHTSRNSTGQILYSFKDSSDIYT
jgi:hypothetical protein